MPKCINSQSFLEPDVLFHLTFYFCASVSTVSVVFLNASRHFKDASSAAGEHSVVECLSVIVKSTAASETQNSQMDNKQNQPKYINHPRLQTDWSRAAQYVLTASTLRCLLINFNTSANFFAASGKKQNLHDSHFLWLIYKRSVSDITSSTVI